MVGIRHHTVQVPATSANLGPGFDAFGLAVDRYLAVRTVDRDGRADRVVAVSNAADELPRGDDNLVWRSFVAFCEVQGVAVPDVGLRVVNDIPLERGLGSSSAAIVAGLVLARALTGAAVGDPDLVGLADELEGHPDNVAPALLGGLVVCARDDGGELVVRRVNPAAHLRPRLLVPPARQATEAARAVVPETLSRTDAATQAARAGHVLAGLAGLWPASARVAGDLLHEPARLAVMRASADVIDGLRAEGVHAWLSGAGPSVGVALTVGDRIGEGVVADVAARHGFACLALRFELSGALACPDGGCAIGGSADCVHCPRSRVS